jgi:hypothetical protein
LAERDVNLVNRWCAPPFVSQRFYQREMFPLLMARVTMGHEEGKVEAQLT